MAGGLCHFATRCHTQPRAADGPPDPASLRQSRGCHLSTHNPACQSGSLPNTPMTDRQTPFPPPTVRARSIRSPARPLLCVGSFSAPPPIPVYSLTDTVVRSFLLPAHGESVSVHFSVDVGFAVGRCVGGRPRRLGSSVRPSAAPSLGSRPRGNQGGHPALDYAKPMQDVPFDGHCRHSLCAAIMGRRGSWSAMSSRRGFWAVGGRPGAKPHHPAMAQPVSDTTP